MNAQATSFSADDLWIADSGASHHMTNTLSNMTNIAPYTSGDTIKIGNGEGLSISHIGTASLSGLHLNTIYHVPQLATNLLSVYQLCKDNNCWVIFDASNVYVQDKATKTLLFQGKSHKGLYPIPQSVSPSIAIPKQPSFLGSKFIPPCGINGLVMFPMTFFISDSSTPIGSPTPAIVVSMPSSPLLVPRSPSTSTVSSSDASSHDTIITSSQPDSTANSSQHPYMHPILDPDQLQVLLPLSPQCSSTSDPLQVSTTHPMQTRSKTGHLPRKDFGDFQCFATTLTDITEAEERRFFKEANSKPEWQQAMVEEIEALT
ncbi:PREDICTED: poly, partial [Prunus dulcis]